MTLQLDLSPELLRWLKEEAARRGTTVEQLVAADVETRWAPARQARSVSSTETPLLLTISEGLPEAFWTRYRELVARRDGGDLKESERAELIQLSDQVEELTVRRAEALLALATLRGIGIDSLRRTLGIAPVPTT